MAQKIYTVNLEGQEILVVETYNPEAFIEAWGKVLQKIKEDPHYKPIMFAEPDEIRETHNHYHEYPERPSLWQRILSFFRGE